MKLIMPMAGNGSRFLDVGIDTPKPLIEVDGVPMFVFAERQLDLDFEDRIFIVRKEHNITEAVKDYYPDAKVIELSHLTEGAASTIMTASQYFDDGSSVFISNCDQSVEWNSSTFDSVSKFDGAIAVFKNEERDPKWSFAETDNSGNVVRVAEKDPISDWATVGWYYWKDGRSLANSYDRMVGVNDRVNGEFYTCPLYNYTIALGGIVKTFEVDSMHGIGTPNDLAAWMEKNR